MSSSQEINNTRFNAEAQEWDSNIKHVESTAKAVEAIKRYVPGFKAGTNKDLNILELGCGTGLLSFALAPSVHSLLGIDTADGMLHAFDTKLSDHPKNTASPPNLSAINHYLTTPDVPEVQAAATKLHNAPPSTPKLRFDVIVSHLTLHHIASLSDMLRTLHACLKPGGCVALTDYEDFGAGAIPFHPVSKRAGVERHGIRRQEMEELLVATGFGGVRVEEAFVLRKEVEAEDGMPVRELDFPFLMCFGVRD
ncbi:S-adenosyl-L-methionine-dependent methyltransferase [Decorospora gaudefroyi]|uniref:S-adenosyl-L-methionine-dependent methyltransferase n=1 Tax=Decorospora gaudefroyi TaxID=184978 RepID=A0A6A5KP27_9PLEO|nr:S-adenosyl-L-methionine-dependent methyltransferase [Decorospora gaudefroyi]